jgi:hypothetical protein
MNRIAVIVVAVALVAGCSEPLSTREKGALIGGGIGAGTGAVVGSAVGHTGAGALIGAGVGVVSGAVIGDAVQAKQRQAAQATPPAAPPPPPAMAPAPTQVVVVSPPPIVVTQSPRYVWVPEWRMYVMEGQDVVYYERTHYYYHAGYWWGAQALTGPWVIVSSPPVAIASLPRGALHAHIGRPGFCPPGQGKKGRC